MPRCVFTDPPDLVSNFENTSTWPATRSLATPSLIVDTDDTELELDMQGRKHVDTTDPDYNGYKLQQDPPGTEDGFKMPGLASANALRAYLAGNLQPHQIVDMYGNECNVHEVPTNHLALLQADVWDAAQNPEPSAVMAASHLSRRQVVAAGHIAGMTQLLRNDHVFVFSKDATRTCHYMDDLLVTMEHQCSSQTVEIAPLVHWGTVTPVAKSDYALIFRRNGELMEQPEYYQLVRRSTTGVPAYCTDCLEHLWHQRSEARDTILLLQRFQSSTTHAASSTPISSINSEENWSQSPEQLLEYVEKPLPQYDGTHSPSASVSKESQDAIWISSDSEESVYSSVWAAKSTNRNSDESVHCSTRRRTSFTVPLRSTSIIPKYSGPPLLSKTLTMIEVTENAFSDKRKSQGSAEMDNNCDSEIVDLITPPRSRERVFGHELDVNTRALLQSPMRKILRSNNKSAAPTEGEISLTRVRPIKPLIAGAKTNELVKEAKKCKPADLVKGPAEQNIARVTTFTNSKTCRLTTVNNSEIDSQLATKPEPEFPPPLPEVTMYYARRPVTMSVPAGIAEEAYQDFLSMRPPDTAKICFCVRPANWFVSNENKKSKSKAEKSGEVQIAQCTNSDCRFQWYHYACLDRSDKGKARWGTLLCEHCRIEREFVDQAKAQEQVTGKPKDHKLQLTKHDIEAALPGLNDQIPGPNPYGLGLEIDVSVAHPPMTRKQGTLGALEHFKYAQSHPYMMEEAYLNSEIYVDLKNRALAMQAEDDEYWRGTRAAEQSPKDEDEEMQD